MGLPNPFAYAVVNPEEYGYYYWLYPTFLCPLEAVTALG
jgi:hypothetical protein